jgi:hypothetical protein
MYLYLDESGDLGFNFKEKRSSEKFVITILVCFNEASKTKKVPGKKYQKSYRVFGKDDGYKRFIRTSL